MPDVYRFEEDNKHLSVNIFVHSEGEFYPAHSTNLDGRNPSERVGVNIVQNTAIDITSGEMMDHYYPVTNLSKFAKKIYILVKFMGKRLTVIIYPVIFAQDLLSVRNLLIIQQASFWKMVRFTWVSPN